MLIEVQAISGIEYINREQITRVQDIRDGILIQFSDQSMTVLTKVEWQKVKEFFVMPSNLEDRYYTLMDTIYRQQHRMLDLDQELETLKNAQSDKPASADDLKSSTSPYNDDLPF